MVLLMEVVDGPGLAAPHVDVIDFSGGSRTKYIGGEHDVPWSTNSGLPDVARG